MVASQSRGDGIESLVQQTECLVRVPGKPKGNGEPVGCCESPRMARPQLRRAKPQGRNVSFELVRVSKAVALESKVRHGLIHLRLFGTGCFARGVKSNAAEFMQ